LNELTARCLEALEGDEWKTAAQVSESIKEPRYDVDLALRRAHEGGLLERRKVRAVWYRRLIKRPTNPVGKPYATGYRWEL